MRKESRRRRVQARERRSGAEGSELESERRSWRRSAAWRWKASISRSEEEGCWVWEWEWWSGGGGGIWSRRWERKERPKEVSGAAADEESVAGIAAAALGLID
ncbi:Os04g0688050 [Oryza sativa Japonica Group]|uniref:Os04g0688050 protein n=1 Tax=Oryza sativa subsp. japonica TaxID=39947 RepID=A0A0N7KJZ0_ORYSJ|nr:Os04g0688050 [Oryza sativa Japonica Group]